MRLLRLAAFVMTFSAGAVVAQVVEPPVVSGGTSVAAWQDHPEMEVKASQQWLVTARFRVSSRPPGFEVRPACCPNTNEVHDLIRGVSRAGWRSSSDRPGVDVQQQWLVLPIVSEGAMQRVHLDSLKSTSQLEAARLDVPARMLQSPMGMQRELGWRFDPPAGRSVNWRVAELEMQFHADLRTVRFDRKKLASIDWPSKWPEAVAGAFMPQLYIDQAPDASGFVRDLDPKGIEQMMAEIEKIAGLTRENRPAPSEAAYQLGQAVYMTLRHSRGNTDATKEGQFARNDPRAFWLADDDAFLRPSRDPDTLTGVPVRDVLTTWRDGKGTNAERSAVLVAAMRRWNIPARLMIGVALDETDLKEAFSPRSGLSTVTVESACGTRTYVIPRPATVVAWVEFALVEQIEGNERVVWVPIDPGSGGNSWKFGTLDNGQYTVALATSLWPSHTRFVGRTGASIGVWRSNLGAWNPTRTGWHLPAGLFGMQSEKQVYTACATEWRVTGRKASRREMDRFLAENGNIVRGAPAPPEDPLGGEPVSPIESVRKQ